ncbi:MAG: protein O-mannosyl-transferase family, partial [Longimicrobiales bacterium]
SLFTIALLSWLAFRWRDRLGEGKDDNLLLLIIFILALSVGNHHMAFLVAPALVLFILLVHPRTLLNRRLYAAGVVAGVLGLSIHLFLPIRSELAPVINEATPTCDSLDSAMVSIVTMGAVPVDEGDRLYRSRAAERLFGWARDIGCENLSAALQREQYNKPSLRQNPITALIDPEDDPTPRDASLFFAQLANYAQYFDWQWARSVEGPRSWFTDLRLPFTALFIMLGLAGAATQYRRDRDGFTYFASLFLTVSIGLVVYLNFKYGFTLPEELMSRDMRALAARPQLRGIVELTEVRERDYFFIVSFSMWGLWAGIGIATVWQDLTERVRRRVERLRSAKLNAALVTAPVMLFALLPLILNWSWASRRNDYTARDWAYNVLMSVEPYAILFTNGDNDTFPLWYLQEVEGIRRDVTVMVMSYLNTPWYAEQLRELTKPCPPGVDPAQDTTRIVCQRPYIGDGLEIYNRAMVPTDAPGVPIDEVPPGRRPPTRSILPLTDEEIVEVSRTPPYLLDQALAYRAGEVETVLPPGAVVTPADAFMASMIHTAIGDRPIYFAMTTRAYEELNLRPYLVRQGVALKLNNGPVEPDSARGIFAVPAGDLALGAPYIDLPRTETLVSDVFVHRGGFPDDWGHWVDSASEQVPFYYAVTHYGLGQVYQHLGYETRAESHYRAGERFLRLSNARQPDS